MDRQQEFVLRTLEERDIRFVRLWFTDVLGTLKSVSVAPAELEAAFEEGIGFDGSAIEGFARVYESDMVAMPDPSTFQVFPFEGGTSGESARMFCDILLPDGSASWADPRHVLRRALSRAAEKGFTFYTHPEIEFFLVQGIPADGGVPEPVDTGGYFDHTTHAVARDFRRQAVLALERIGISVEYSHHEVAPGQQEIDLRYADALTTADNIMTFRHVVKEVALSHNVHATFMPKPFTDQPGSGMHTHLSLFEGDRNAFHDPADPMKMSKVGQAVHRRAARARPGVHRGHQPVGQLVQAAVPAGAGRDGSPRRRRTCAGATSTGRRWCGCPPTASRTRPGWRSARWTGVQSVPGLRGPARRRAEGHRGGLRTATGCRGRRVVTVRCGAPRHGLRDVAGEPVRRGRGDGQVGAGRRGVGRARVRLLPAQQAQ